MRAARAGELSAPGAAEDWQSYPDRRLDEIDVNLRAFGPGAEFPEIRDFATMLARVAPNVDLVRAGRAVIAAAREADRDARRLAELRKQARAEIDLALRRDSSADGDLGLFRIVEIAERAGVDPSIARAPVEALLLPRDDPRRKRAMTLALRNLHVALASQGNQPTPIRRLADRIAIVFSIATSRDLTVTIAPDGGAASGAWLDFLTASAALAGITAQPSEISNVARVVANPMKKREKSRLN
ncbi:MAG: hypothetical protein INF18_05005 [Methylobacterium sp.]|nr:hypothetical protein [Methylobacterium sp.]MCA3637803.1 hypothetical protein [Methylobacterium sp.]